MVHGIPTHYHLHAVPQSPKMYLPKGGIGFPSEFRTNDEIYLFYYYWLRLATTNGQPSSLLPLPCPAKPLTSEQTDRVSERAALASEKRPCERLSSRSLNFTLHHSAVMAGLSSPSPPSDSLAADHAV